MAICLRGFIQMVKVMVLNDREEWLKHRTRIGGSDASAILGANPWKDNVRLWEEKVNNLPPEDISDKDCVKYGVATEPLLRELFTLDHPEYQVNYVENNMWLNDKYPYAHASLDGWLVEKSTGRKGILEIKTTEILAPGQKKKWGVPWDPALPQNYYIQILHYLMVTEFDFAVLNAQLKQYYRDPEGEQIMEKSTRFCVVERSEIEADISYLVEKEAEFWEKVQTRKRPPLLLPDV